MMKVSLWGNTIAILSVLQVASQSTGEQGGPEERICSVLGNASCIQDPSLLPCNSSISSYGLAGLSGRQKAGL